MTTVASKPETTAAPAPSENGSAPAAPAPTPAPPAKPARDPRYLALRNFAISMSVFNILGYTLFGFEQPWLWPILAVLLGYTIELTLESLRAWAGRRPPEFRGNGFRGLWTFLLPAHITSLAVNLLLYANDRFLPIAFGVVVGVGAKYILVAPIRGRMRHFMNPSNFGITAALLAFSWVNIAPPYHFTENVPGVFKILIPMVILTAGTTLNAVLTKKVMLILGWAGAFVLQAVVRWALFDVALLSALAVMTGVAFVLFTNYMISDPGTTPVTGRAQFVFGSSVAVVYGVLMSFNVVYTLFFAVCLVCLARGLGWWVAWGIGKWRERARAGEQESTSPSELEAVPA